MIALRLQSSDSTTAAALAAAVSRQGWCEALSAALGSGYRVVWRDAGDVARVTLTMSGTLPISEQRVHISAQPAAVSCSSGTPTKTLLESADGTRWALLERMVPLVDGSGSPLAPVTGAGFRWVDPLVVQPPAGLSALPAWLQGAPVMAWHEISGTTLLPTLDDDPYLGVNAGNTLARSDAWCGAALKHSGSEMFISLGGHADGSGNAVYSIRLQDDAPHWVMRRGNSVPVTTEVSHYSDGRPSSRHTYWQIQYHQQRELLMFFGACAVYGSGNGNFNDVDAFDPSVNDWLPASTFPPTPTKYVEMPVAMDAAGNCYFQTGGGSNPLFKWDTSAGSYGTWSSLLSSTPVFSSDYPMAWDSTRNRLVRFDTTAPTIYDLSTGGTRSVGTYSGETSLITRRSAAIYCPDRDSFLHIRYGRMQAGEAVIAEIDPESFAVSALSLAGTGPTLGSNGGGGEDFYGRFCYVPELRSVVLMPRITKNLYAIRVG